MKIIGVTVIHGTDPYTRRLRAVETSLTQIQASLFSTTDVKHSRPEVAQSVAERTARDAPMSLIQEIRENITLHRQPLQIQDISEDIIHNGIISEETALILLKGYDPLRKKLLAI
ncbi:hypothetical protein N7495_004152 [Penicillium taxi]|uniref:uncharacterized protein n=1 Tax=Penicillium taxi TaxID=168475 RepID=UPI0025452A5A|nr:uncharacterized protein N7495_004152 [Penicillium taxi]KAJ5899408.1 hypothetical protein N7495_004152 [Penicillium taxi]